MSDTIRILASPRWQFFTDAGAPASGYYVYTYEPGTTTNKATYQDTAGSVANTNPIVLNARGEATIFWDGLYKVSVYTGDKDVDGVLVYTEDDYGVNVQTPTIGNYNLINNGDMETATADPTLPDSWTVTLYTDGTAALDSVDQYAGANSIKFASVGTGGGYAESNFFAVQEGKNLSVNWAMESSVATVRNVVEIIWYTSAQVQVSTTSVYDNSTINPTSWTSKIASVIPPSTARFGKIRITGCHSSVSTVGNTHFDNVIVAQHADGDGSGLVAGLVGSLTQAQLDAIETVPSTTMDGLADLTNAEIITLDSSAQAVSGFTYSNIYFIDDEGDSQTGNTFDVDTVIGAAWESIGPTGSGATNIWTALDVLPASAKWVEIKIINVAYFASGYCSSKIYARKTGSSFGISIATQISEAYFSQNTSATVTVTTTSNVSTVKIPVDSNIRFDLYLAATSGSTVDISLIGFGA